MAQRAEVQTQVATRSSIALEVQQAFAARMTRVGMPVRPPISRRADVELYFKGEGGACKRAGEKITDGAVVFRGRSAEGKDEDQFVITLDCVKKIVKQLVDVVAACRKEKTTCGTRCERGWLRT